MTGPEVPRRGRIKCVVWDLDNTVWDGVLLEGDQLNLRPGIEQVIKSLDERGILHSIASRSDQEAALTQLRQFGLAEYFLHPQINWSPKSASIQEIARLLNIGIDAIAFVDDEPFELEEVVFALPQVLGIAAGEIVDAASSREEFLPRFVTDDSRVRRKLYRSSLQRDQAEREFAGTSEEFLATLGMVFTIAPAEEADLQRAEELTLRTNQLNSTGRTYSYEELDALRRSSDHLLLVATLEDRFGSYGKIGLALIETVRPIWVLRLLLMSCRVMSRGVGTVLLHHVMSLAHERDVRLQAQLVETGRNRVMYVTYRFAGFRTVSREGDVLVLECAPALAQPPPPYVKLRLGSYSAQA